MNYKPFLFFGLLVLYFVHGVKSQTAAVSFPDNSNGAIAREWVELINNGDDAALKSFITNRFSESALKQQKLEDLFVLFRNLQKQSGGIEVRSVRPNTGQLPLAFEIKSKTGDHYGLVRMGMNGEKLAGIGIDKIENPLMPGWKEGKLSESEMIAEIRKQVKIRAENGDFSGVVLIARNDRILLNEPLGYADRESKIPNTTETRFHLASVGKMFTVAAVATLVKSGKISFTDTVEKLLPDFPHREVFSKITVHQLLSHSAGLGTFFESPGFDPQKRYRNSMEEIAVYQDEPLFFAPGTKWRYSNAGYSLLGAIIEKVSGQTYRGYIRENVFQPLQMKDTDPGSFDISTRNAAVLYQQTEVDPFGLEPYLVNRELASSPATAFGGGFTTTLDLYRFARAYQTGSLLGKDLTDTIVTPKIEVGQNQFWGYGITQTTVNGEIVRGHSGGSRADLAILWNSGYIVVVLGNVTPPSVAALSSRIVDYISKQRNS